MYKPTNKITPSRANVLLKTVLGIPSYTGQEDRLIEYLTQYAASQGWLCYVRDRNVYVQNYLASEHDRVPCFVAHTDTVHEITDMAIIEADIPHPKSGELTRALKAVDRNGEPTGCGGDDKAGVAIALNLLHEVPNAKAAFFHSEETGCHGSRKADDAFFKDVGYVIQFDSPENDRSTHYCMGVKLYSDAFAETIRPLLGSHGINRHMNDPYTDVSILKSKYDFTCLNLPAGYYNMHTPDEYVVIEDVEKSVRVALDVVSLLGYEHHAFAPQKDTWADCFDDPCSPKHERISDYEDDYGYGYGSAYDYDYVDVEFDSEYGFIRAKMSDCDVKDITIDNAVVTENDVDYEDIVLCIEAEFEKRF